MGESPIKLLIFEQSDDRMIKKRRVAGRPRFQENEMVARNGLDLEIRGAFLCG